MGAFAPSAAGAAAWGAGVEAAGAAGLESEQPATVAATATPRTNEPVSRRMAMMGITSMEFGRGRSKEARVPAATDIPGPVQRHGGDGDATRNEAGETG